MDILSKLPAPEGAVKDRKRVGRGPGSGMGKTATRGQKGQKARSKGNINKKHFQGGQTPMQRRLPKRGFRNPLATLVHEVNIGDIHEAFEAGTAVDLEALVTRRLVRARLEDLQTARELVKILGDGDFSKELTISAHRFSKSAAAKISAAGGSLVELSSLPPKRAAAG